MVRIKTLQELFKRYRRPGDLVFACLFMAFSLFLLSQLGSQTSWTPRTKLFAQPAFWPTVSIAAMTAFAALHLFSSAVSPRIPGRWKEVWQWVRSFEYAAWFMIYVLVVPLAGYLLSTIAFMTLLGLRVGYRSYRTLAWLPVIAVFIVVVFKSFLQVKVPGGEIYLYLPEGLRAFMLTYL